MKEKTQETLTAFEYARRRGVPIVGIESADPAATIVKCMATLNGATDKTPLLRQDVVRGLAPLSKAGSAVLQDLTEDLDGSFDPSRCLNALTVKASKLIFNEETEDEDGKKKIVSRGAIVFMVHANRWLEQTAELQAVWNARDVFEKHGITLVLLGPSIKLPIELKNDVVIITEPLPDHDDLGRILDDIAKEAKLKPDQIEDRESVIDTMSGTSAFGARQILAMSVRRDGIDTDQLWERKRKMIEQTPGLAVWKGGSKFDDLGGLENLKDFLTRVLTSGSSPCRAIGFMDEIEKALAGAGGDMSGTSQDQLGVLLSEMQNNDIPGIILVGHAGCGKSEIAKGAGNVANAPVISIDLGAMKGSLVGESEARIRAAVAVFKAVSQGKGMIIATCNKISSLPPELRRRFTLGTFFVDLPSAAERDLIWPIWISRYGLKKQALPDCEDWTGAEIKACCNVAYRTGLTLKDAARFVVPVIKSAPEQVEALRTLANNRFISAAKPGVYKYEKATEHETQTGRKIQI